MVDGVYLIMMSLNHYKFRGLSEQHIIIGGTLARYGLKLLMVGRLIV